MKNVKASLVKTALTLCFALVMATVVSPTVASAGVSTPGNCTYTITLLGNYAKLSNLVCPSGTSRAGYGFASKPGNTTYGPTIYSNMGKTSTATLVGWTSKGVSVWKTG